MSRLWSVLHLFSGIGGCTEGFRRSGKFRSVGSFDFDAKACAQLAVRGTFLALEAWEKPPGLILIENVPRIQTRGAPLLEQIVKMLQRYGYATDQGTHDCGEIGGLAQHRQRFLLVARHMARVPDFLRKPPKKRVRNVGEVLLDLPSPAADHGDPMHRLPLLSPLNWLRLALIPPGKDWRALPPSVRIGGDHPRHPRAGSYGVTDVGDPAGTVRGRHDVWTAPASIADTRVGFAGPNTQSGILGVEDPDAPAHVVTGNARVTGSRGAFADPRVAWDPATHGGRPDSWGVGSMDEPSLTVRARQEVQTSRASIADPRLGDRPGRQNGGFGVEDADQPAHAVLGEGTIRNTRASFADPRLGCEQRSGSYGVQDPDQPGATVVGHHSHDNSPGSLADPRLAHEPRRGSMGVMDPGAPAPTIRGQHSARQATAAIVDSSGWPIPTHYLVIEDGGPVLYGPPIDLRPKARPCLLVIARLVECKTRGRWHRGLTDRELFMLQGGDRTHVIEGPRSSSKTQAGVREWVGNMIPVDTAEVLALETDITLSSSSLATFLRGPDVWVERADAVALAEDGYQENQRT